LLRRDEVFECALAQAARIKHDLGFALGVVGSASPVASWVSIATPLNVAAPSGGSNRPDEMPEVDCRNPEV
jgi:hypothetical protein